MGNNSSPYDEEAERKAKTTRELQEQIRFWTEALKKHDYPGGRIQLARIKAEIAQRIGRKR